MTANEAISPEGRRRKLGKGPIFMICPHYQEYSYLFARSMARDRQVVMHIDCAALDEEYNGRLRPSAPGLTLRDTNFTTPLDMARILWDVIRFRPSVIHIQEPAGLIKAAMVAVVVFVFQMFSIIALTVHDPLPHHGRDEIVARRLAYLRRYIRSRAATVFVHGSFCQRQYLESGQPEGQRVILTEHGSILKSDKPGKRDLGPFTLLSFGRMEAYKGVGVLFAAVAELSGDEFPPQFHLAGSGPEMDRLGDQFRALPNVRVDDRFIPAAELVAFITSADCVVLPYLEATQSGVLAAALANGRFVIASRTGGIPDVIEDGVNGLLVPPGDASALVAAVRRAASDVSLRMRLAQGSLDTASDRLDWDRIAPAVLASY